MEAVKGTATLKEIKRSSQKGEAITTIILVSETCRNQSDLDMKVGEQFNYTLSPLQARFDYEGNGIS
jgi:hypothetical protein